MDRQTLSNKIWQCCNIMRRDKLVPLQYVEQLSWLLFLKLFNDLEKQQELLKSNISQFLMRNIDGTTGLAKKRVKN